MIKCDDCGHLISEPSRETPEEWEERTGQTLQPTDMVWVLFGLPHDQSWGVCGFGEYMKKFSNHNDGPGLPVIVVKPGAGKPGIGWSPTK